MGWWTRWGTGPVCGDYKALLDQVLNGTLSVEAFMTLYFERFKNETRPMSETVFQVLDGVFADLDVFTTDPELLAAKPDFYLDEKQLQARIHDAARRLASLID